MKDLLIHPNTRQHLQAYLDNPTQSVMLVGPAGSGKATLARRLAEQILDIRDLSDHAYGLIISSEDGKAIGIEAVRGLEQFLSLKVPSRSKYNRLVLIDDAHLMSLEAQNALLKTLEEPPAGTLLVLNASHKQGLLPTIQSRTQIININRPDRQASADYFKDHDSQKISQAYAISGGLPGLMSALLNQEDHPLTEATARARQLLQQSSFERLAMVDELAKQKQMAADILFILQQMAHVSLLSAQGAAAERWQRVLKISYQTAESLKANAQPKLALDHLMLNL